MQTTVEDTQPQTQTTPEPKQEKEIQEPLRVITRAQSKLAQENAIKMGGSQAPRECTDRTKTKKAKSAIGPTTSSPIHGDDRVSEEPVSE